MTEDSATLSTPEARGMRRRVAQASFIGTTVEWYDFYLYGTASALVFNQLFFPTFDSAVGTIAAFGTFAAGFLARPIGGIVFGHFGDRLGRKKMLIISLVGMGIATSLIGLLPTYSQVGLAAPVLLILLRLIQGFAVGGEWGGAVLMSVEHAERGRRGLAGSWTQMGSPAGLVISTIAFGLASLLPDASFTAWGWRIPFLFSAILVAVGLFIRLRVVESPAFTAVEESGRKSSIPLLDALRRHPLNILLAIATCLAPFVNFYLFAIFMLSYATTSLDIQRPVALTILAIAGAIEIFTTPIAAALSDRFGRRRVFLTGTVLLAVYSFPFFMINEAAHSPVVLAITTIVGLSLIHPLMYGPLATLFTELFSPEVRYSGASLGYQIGGILGGGFAPLILTALMATGIGASVAIPPYIILLCVLTFIAVWVATRPGRRWESDEHLTNTTRTGSAA
ncbi:MFS transporter [Microlunatus soli]|uniref:Putative proline/betaine transporter n=1 Tax=Microlunatus soli TaxID=630515 RepID=A0A1H1TU48_9ACTN|nr:MFS transporter [Microlunatus soli]SDS63621.1 metabolite-proton symporter [Microlunatus soli]